MGCNQKYFVYVPNVAVLCRLGDNGTGKLN